MIALDINVKNENNNYLGKIFSGIDVLQYEWEIIHEDFLYYDNGERKEKFFEIDILSGEEFLKCISRDKYYMIFLDIKAYPINSKRVEINTFKDFLESNCEFVFLCTDSGFIEFYCKDRDILDKVYNNCICNGFEKVQYKSIADVSGRNLV
ncbi:DUF2691 family protein, partial [Ruminiclostridium hungatei]|uniref:DUF2691 family protein n=1 Tax=Ruminiclostridium hungatei TaxID=48256 RepID=UPI0009AEA104